MKSILRIVAAIGMALIGLIFAGVVIFLCGLFLSPERPRLSSPFILLSILAFLSILAYISFVFAWRFARGKRTSLGTYLPPWAIVFVIVAALAGWIGNAITKHDWILATKCIPVVLIMLLFVINTYKRKKPNKMQEDTARKLADPQH
ncbi:MAG: hypothetical protein PHI84_21575 [Kiritimatiellae bacterium]|nr:hypothetical protein [Kiritimatiellia bacterium]